MSQDLYEVLGVDRQVDTVELKRAYRRLARELHPDANPGDTQAEKRFKEVAAAYEVLSHPERRSHYDRFGHDGLTADTGDPFGGLGGLFESFFGRGTPGGFAGARRRSTPPGGEDLEVDLVLTFEEAVFGCTKEIEVRSAFPCTTCQAAGAASGTTRQTCDNCAGSGQVQSVRQSLLGQMISASPCPRCAGWGWSIPEPCADCDGEGRLIGPVTLTVEVRAGVDDGTTLRLRGQGAVGKWAGPPGDIYVLLRVCPHETLMRQGSDLVHRVHLPITQAALGTDLELEVLDGVVNLQIPPGTSTGEVLRFQGLGVPYLESRGRGDLLVELVIETPMSLSDKEEEVLRHFAELRGEEVAPPASGLISRIRSTFG